MTLAPARMLWLLAALLGAGLAVVVTTRGPKPPVIRPLLPPASAQVASAAAPVASWAATVLGRPLFSPSRRPAPGATQAAAGPEAAGLPRLAGIIITPRERRAIFAGKGDGPATIAAEGTRVGLWLVETIRPNGVDVTGPGGRRTLLPRFGDEPPPPAPPPPAPALGGNLLPAPPSLPGNGQPSGLDLFHNAPAPAGMKAPL